MIALASFNNLSSARSEGVTASSFRRPITFPKLQTYTFDSRDLYGASGNPSPQDIRQNNLNDCYLVASLAALAQRQPERIKDAISYDPFTGTFNVKLYDSGGKQVTIAVTQKEIEDNVARGGGSTLDNSVSRTDGPAWPAVMETAYAKMYDKNWSDGLAEGYANIEFDWPDVAMQALTGQRGTYVSALAGSKASSIETQLSRAIQEGRPITLTTNPQESPLSGVVLGTTPKQDGLVDNHVYMVERVYTGTDGRVKVELRNPWATNVVGEVAAKDTSSAVVTIDLQETIDLGGLNKFHVGPKPQGTWTAALGSINQLLATIASRA